MIFVCYAFEGHIHPCGLLLDSPGLYHLYYISQKKFFIGSLGSTIYCNDALLCLVWNQTVTLSSSLYSLQEAERLQKAEEDEQPLAESPVPAASSEAGAGDTTTLASSNKPYNESEDDLALQAAMYGVLFQVYADNQDWQEGLKLMDTAITSMPRTKHRLWVACWLGKCLLVLLIIMSRYV